MLLLHNSYGTLEFPDCGNLVWADWMENLRWANMEPSMHLTKANTEFLLPVLLPTLLMISLPSLLPFLLPVLMLI